MGNKHRSQASGEDGVRGGAGSIDKNGEVSEHRAEPSIARVWTAKCANTPRATRFSISEAGTRTTDPASCPRPVSAARGAAGDLLRTGCQHPGQAGGLAAANRPTIKEPRLIAPETQWQARRRPKYEER